MLNCRKLAITIRSVDR